MNIKFNEVTWYSKLLAAFVFFIVIPILFFCFGVQFENIKYNNNNLYNNKNTINIDGGVKESSGFKIKKAMPVVEENNKLNFKCDSSKKFSLEYFQMSNSPGPGEIYIPNGVAVITIKFANGSFEDLTFSKISDGGHVNQYLNQDSTVLFQTNSDKAFIKQNGVTTYKNCVVVE